MSTVQTGQHKRLATPAAGRRSASSKPIILRGGAVRLRRKGFSVCIANKLGVRRAGERHWFIGSTRLRLEDLAYSGGVLSRLFTLHTEVNGMQAWHEFLAARSEFEAVFRRLRRRYARYRHAVYGVPLPDDGGGDGGKAELLVPPCYLRSLPALIETYLNNLFGIKSD